MSDKPTLQGVSNVEDLQQKGMWKTLETISTQISGIQDTLKEVIRLQERVNNLGHKVAKHGDRIEAHDDRIKENELWQAKNGDSSSAMRCITTLQEDFKSMERGLKNDIKDIKTEFDKLKTESYTTKGQLNISGKVVAWLAAIAASAIVIFFKGK